MAVCAIYILGPKNRILISRKYRDEVDDENIKSLTRIIDDNEDNNCYTPVACVSNVPYCFIKHNSLIVVAAASLKANIALIFVFLHKLVDIMEKYFNKLVEESIRDNFVVIYELLDELLDFGYPQTTDCDVLKKYILEQSHKLTVSKVPLAVTSSVSWRVPGIYYRKNEIFIDVIESVNVLINANGSVVKSEVVGSVNLKVCLSGMPRLRLVLNDRIEPGRKSDQMKVEDVKFHQCVNLSRYELERSICFIPPDGEFVLMSYRLNADVRPLIMVECIVERHRYSRIQYLIKVRSQFKKRSVAKDVQILIPVPRDATSPRFRKNVGVVKYLPEENCVAWSLKSLEGGAEHMMHAHMELTSVESDEEEDRMPVRVQFEVPYFTTSGMQIRCLKIMETSGYTALPWVRYLTKSGDYRIRINK